MTYRKAGGSPSPSCESDPFNHYLDFYPSVIKPKKSLERSIKISTRTIRLNSYDAIASFGEVRFSGYLEGTSVRGTYQWVAIEVDYFVSTRFHVEPFHDVLEILSVPKEFIESTG